MSLKEDVEIGEQLYAPHSTPSSWKTEQRFTFEAKVLGFIISR